LTRPQGRFFANILLATVGEVLELADSLDLGSSAARRGGSNPPFPTARRGLLKAC
jgi:hypothetical protein